ncbi:hypothetical protein EPUS_04490 [Endocarpon pusillum Z07020]|uniref:Uncharacterized protein n=1 Tax=Endocarpon pusillum (strain Z07020 / HMAS-L-300199) TaxID=1263415 RepID=U1G9Z9_ENDPU|nr:uncharacterized protein EPUS_04490 [Endocarpon pusillum Z07020]ERF68838.1 hypothetical protein EPUS_04490 [Endocarpon pusillum Z07020]
MPPSNHDACPSSLSSTHSAPDKTKSSSPALDALQAELDALLDYHLYLSEPEVHKATHDLLRGYSHIVPTLCFVEQQNKITSEIATVSEERTRLQNKSVEMVAKAKACKEKVALLREKLVACEKRDDVGTEEHVAVDGKLDVVPGTNVIAGQEKWLRLL